MISHSRFSYDMEWKWIHCAFWLDDGSLAAAIVVAVGLDGILLFCGVNKKARTDRRPDGFEAIAPNSANHVFGPPNKLEATQHFSRLQQKLNTVIKA